jgi:uroporphyrin-III C-methyltransferase/precorrin-2 dehydrogenase/sirohydrochlorin ferrochelatase
MSEDPRRGWRFPIVIDLAGRPVVVVGGGAVAERKIEILIEAGARVTVVSPEVTDRVARWARGGRIALERRRYRAGDLAGARLAYAATSDPAVNRAVREEAVREDAWLNVIDEPDLCDFISPAVLRRGDLTIAVSTSGRVPALSKQIREELELRYGPEYAETVQRLGDQRDAKRRAQGEPRARGTAPPAGGTPDPPGRRAGVVYLVGAGPGDPELLTMKGRRLLEAAEVVVYDALVDGRIVDLCPPSAARIFVGKRDHRHSLPQSEINARLVEEARAGRTVVRLKGGDPFIFGRGGEEAEALVEAGIRYEVVPGVSAGVAVPAYAGIPLTHRDFTSELVFLTGHACTGSQFPVDWRRYANSSASLVIFMGLHNLGTIARELVHGGRDPACPAAVIEHGTTDEQRTIVAPLSRIADEAAAAGVEPPALIVIGDVVSLRDRLTWFR